MKASDLFIKCLEQEGIEYIFGVPGEENADFMMSLAESKTIKFILTRHEQGAAFMAEAYGRLTGHTAVSLGTLGPGATNLITGVADSNMDRAPMLVITGQADSKRQHKESHQHMDVVAMFRPVTKWTQAVYHPDNIPEIVRKAVRIARSEKPGVCHIELPEDIAKLKTSQEPMATRRFRRPVADDKIVNKAWETIVNAKSPIILAGNGCIRKRASKQLRILCEKTGIGVISTFMGKGSVDMNSAFCLYTIGLQSDDYPALAVANADVVITLGYDMVEYHPRLWNPDKSKKIIHIDFLPAEIDANYHPETEIVGDLAHALWMLNERVDKYLSDKGAFDFDLSFQKKIRDQMWRDISAEKNDKSKGKIKPQKILWDVRHTLGADDILLSDVGAHKMWVARYYQCHEPNTCLIPNGFCSMGFALPGAIAASLVHPDRNIVAICGDAGFLMNVQEMETAKRIGVKIVVIVWEDNEYGLIKWKQQNEFGKHTDLDFGNPNWLMLAESFGWNGHICDDSQNFQTVLETALNEEAPSLVVTPIDYAENLKLSKRLGKIECAI